MHFAKFTDAKYMKHSQAQGPCPDRKTLVICTSCSLSPALTYMQTKWNDILSDKNPKIHYEKACAFNVYIVVFWVTTKLSAITTPTITQIFTTIKMSYSYTIST